RHCLMTPVHVGEANNRRAVGRSPDGSSTASRLSFRQPIVGSGRLWHGMRTGLARVGVSLEAFPQEVSACARPRSFHPRSWRPSSSACQGKPLAGPPSRTAQAYRACPDTLDDDQVLPVAETGAHIEVALWQRRPEVVPLRPVYPGASLIDARFLDGGQVALLVGLPAQAAAPGASRELWRLDPTTGQVA